MHPYLKTKVEDVICKRSMRCSVEADAPQWCAKQCCLHPARLPLGRSAAAAGLHGNGMFRVELTSDESALPKSCLAPAFDMGKGVMKLSSPTPTSYGRAPALALESSCAEIVEICITVHRAT